MAFCSSLTSDNFSTFSISLFIKMDSDAETRISVRFLAESGDELGTPVVLPKSTTAAELQLLCNQFLEKEDDPIPIAFRTPDGVDIVETIESSLKENLNVEQVSLHISETTFYI